MQGVVPSRFLLADAEEDDESAQRSLRVAEDREAHG
ncbi:hypothetical protein F443_18162 [Phytophthora nicotianae P1569]|uniref:Uncharacterized protein n=1 Tax=Phytophthora nicotianae P1569 TaxID=1317065 RepID=V9E8R7_PHYNI|nr:hypothetical protein F443_18162 [Phytophthora nicotianae P1569]